MSDVKTAFLFPGQGSQSLGMMAELAAEQAIVCETFAAASDALDMDLWALCQEGPLELLNRTTNTQPAMLAAGIATWRVWLAAGGAKPDHLAGHSLGEYSALVAAESINFEDAVRLVRRRGELMQAAVPEGEGAMAAIIGMEDEALEKLCLDVAGDEIVSCANYNAPGQVVIAGQRNAVQRACEMALDVGARRALPLPVSVPSHCMLMRDAAGELHEALNAIAIETPAIPVIHNADVQAHDDPELIRDTLARQLWQPVRWTRTIQALSAAGTGRFVECGPGKVLAGLNRRIERQLPIDALTDMAALKQLQEELAA